MATFGVWSDRITRRRRATTPPAPTPMPSLVALPVFYKVSAQFPDLLDSVPLVDDVVGIEVLLVQRLECRAPSFQTRVAQPFTKSAVAMRAEHCGSIVDRSYDWQRRLASDSGVCFAATCAWPADDSQTPRIIGGPTTGDLGSTQQRERQWHAPADHVASDACRDDARWRAVGLVDGRAHARALSVVDARTRRARWLHVAHAPRRQRALVARFGGTAGGFAVKSDSILQYYCANPLPLRYRFVLLDPALASVDCDQHDMHAQGERAHAQQCGDDYQVEKIRYHARPLLTLGADVSVCRPDLELAGLRVRLRPIRRWLRRDASWSRTRSRAARRRWTATCRRFRRRCSTARRRCCRTRPRAASRTSC